MRTAGVHLAWVVLVLALGSTFVAADDLTGSNKFLCMASHASVCWVDGTCETGPPWNWDVPQFIEIDISQKRLATTRASGENRSTTIENLRRDGGHIILQGYENGRAYSFFIEEKTGYTTVTVTRPDLGVTVFGACTPKTASE